MPQLRDPNFSRTVVLLCEHGPEGAVGFVVNRPTDIRAANAVALDPPPKRDSGLRLWTGGPVETNRGFLLLGNDPDVEQSQRVGDGFYLTVVDGRAAPAARGAPARAAATALPACCSATPAGGRGSSTRSWPTSAWLTAPADPDLVFGTPARGHVGDGHPRARGRSDGAQPRARRAVSGAQGRPAD